MILNRRLTLSRATIAKSSSLLAAIETAVGDHAIRWYISAADDTQIVVEATLYDADVAARRYPTHRAVFPGQSAVLNIVPTGIGCDIGGYAGDATPSNNLLAAVSDYVITNPNTVNASNFLHLEENVVYAEGHAIDLFCRGAVDFHLPHANRVGVIVEKAADHDLDMVFNVINAVRAIHGVNIAAVVVTDEPVGTTCVRNADGAFAGTVRNPDALLRACAALVEQGANAIAVTTDVQDLPADLYAAHFQGRCPNPVGGAEAVISHLLTRRFGLPVAHAPLRNFKPADLPSGVVDPRGAGEMASATGLACVLMGLRNAPQLVPTASTPVQSILNVHNLLAVVMPATSLGGVPVLHAHARGIPIIAVRANQTILDVSAATLGLDGVIEARSYAEAAGLLVALRHGIDLRSLDRPLRALSHGA